MVDQHKWQHTMYLIQESVFSCLSLASRVNVGVLRQGKACGPALPGCGCPGHFGRRASYVLTGSLAECWRLPASGLSGAVHVIFQYYHWCLSQHGFLLKVMQNPVWGKVKLFVIIFTLRHSSLYLHLNKSRFLFSSVLAHSSTYKFLFFVTTLSTISPAFFLSLHEPRHQYWKHASIFSGLFPVRNAGNCTDVCARMVVGLISL